MWIRSIRARLAIASALPILLLTPLLTLYLLYTLEQMYTEKLLERLSGQATILVNQVQARPDLVDNAPAAQNFLSEIARMSDARIVLLSEDGAILASTRPDDHAWLGQHYPFPELELVRQGIHMRGSGLGLAAEVVYLTMPVRHQGDITGMLRLSYSINDIRTEFNQLRQLVLGGVGATALLAFALGLVLATTITDPIHELIGRIRKLAAGDLRARVPVQRKDELGTLAQSFNQMAARIEEAEAVRQRQLAAIVHELARPLTGMRAAVETLADGAAEDREVCNDLLSGMGEEIARLERLLGTLQTFDQRVIRPLKVQQHAMQLAPVVQASVAHFELVAAQRGVKLCNQIAADLPAVYADEDRLIQLIINLIDNALKFSSSGGKITLNAYAHAGKAHADKAHAGQMRTGQIVVSVADTGEGIATDELPHLFQQFYRGAESRPIEKRGMGLGLAICREIVQAHGGEIWVESKLGQGTCVYFSLPEVCTAAPSRALAPVRVLGQV